MVKVTALLASTRSVAYVGLATLTANRLFATSWGFAVPRRPVLNEEVKFQGLNVRSLRERLQALDLPRSGSGDVLRLRLAGAEHRVEATALSKRRRQRVRWAQEQHYWNLSRRGWYVRPPPSLGRGSRNPLCELGECGDTACALYRFRAGCEGTARWDVAVFTSIGSCWIALPRVQGFPLTRSGLWTGPSGRMQLSLRMSSRRSQLSASGLQAHSTCMPSGRCVL
ncbi:unnamed protein product [Symbiodinium sp. CCMP2456]|nr:unnamed protein product [Symbiodinium sp. CCMP2456]